MEKQQLEKLFLEHQKLTKEAFVKRFCDSGTYLTDSGTINGVCRQVSADEILNFQGAMDAELLEKLKQINEEIS